MNHNYLANGSLIPSHASCTSFPFRKGLHKLEEIEAEAETPPTEIGIFAELSFACMNMSQLHQDEIFFPASRERIKSLSLSHLFIESTFNHLEWFQTI